MNHSADEARPQRSSNSHADDNFQLALEQHRAGDLLKAEAYYRQVLMVRRDHPDALHLLGLIAHQRQRYDVAADLMRQAIDANGNQAAYLVKVAAALHDQGDVDGAALVRNQVAQMKRALAEVHSNLGTVLRDQGKLDEAIAAYREAAVISPEYAEAHCNLGALLRRQGKLEEAIAAHRQAVFLRPDSAEAHSCLGLALRDRRELDEAVSAHREAVRIAPDHAEFYSNLGNALSERGDLDEAVVAYRNALGIQPALADLHSNLANALRDQGKLDDAIAAYNEAVRLGPDRAEFHLNLGIALRDQGKLEDALAAYRKALALKPDFVEIHSNIGVALIELGRFSESQAILEAAIQLAPRDTKCRRTLAQLVRFGAEDPHLEAMEELSEDGNSLAIEDRIHLHFALAKAYEDVGRHAEAFQQLLEGNALKRGQITYLEATTLELMDRIRAAFTSELVQRLQNKGAPSSSPIFIVGMPRSGTTLIEQILASHRDVFGGGEMRHFGEVVGHMRANSWGPLNFPEGVTALIDQDFRNLGARYVADTAPYAPAAARITDKMPGNFLYAGLIHLALPNAVIIHARRDPVDTCVSCFSKLFGDEQGHTYDLAELGRYYRRYQMLMTHWRDVLPPGRILDVQYENVVRDLEGQARRIIERCGLEWDSRCLDFYKTERPVRTASAVQVRQPIYGSSIGRGRRYTHLLGPLLAELEGAHYLQIG
jgi:tetratricopeptide (TPR) repeat protein